MIGAISHQKMLLLVPKRVSIVGENLWIKSMFMTLWTKTKESIVVPSAKPICLQMWLPPYPDSLKMNRPIAIESMVMITAKIKNLFRTSKLSPFKTSIEFINGKLL